MRIISGKYRGHVLRPPTGLPVRPTTDRAKESLFNILENKYYIDQLTILDLFSGTGNIAFEFASRGATEVVCVDKYPKCCKYIYSEAQKMGLSQIHTVTEDVLHFIKNCPAQYTIIFADPPYDMPNQEDLIGLIFEKELLKENGMLIWEHHKNLTFKNLKHYAETRNYGDSAFSFFAINE